MPDTQHGVTQEIFIVCVLNSNWKVKIGGRRGNFTPCGRKVGVQGKAVIFVEKAASDTYCVSMGKVLNLSIKPSFSL